MILVDTGAIYALADRRDANHARATAYLQVPSRQRFALSWLIVTESAILLEGRLGMPTARAFWDDVSGGSFEELPVDEALLTAARTIDRQYEGLELGLVDCTSLALCERHAIRKVFTFDHRHFGAYRPRFAPFLEIVP